MSSINKLHNDIDPDKRRLCPNFDEYMENMQEDLEELVMIPTKKRLKIMIFTTRDPIRKLFKIINIDESSSDFNWYKIPRKIYNKFKCIVYQQLDEKCRKGVNFGRVKKETMNKHNIWALFKGYWFHNAPKVMTIYLWAPLLISISKYFKLISLTYNTSTFPAIEVEEFLKKTFLKNLHEVHCQINAQSNPAGPVIQFAAWKIAQLQRVLYRQFDKTYNIHLNRWLQIKQQNGKHNNKKIRVNKVIQCYVKPYSQKQWRQFCDSYDIKHDDTEFKVEMVDIDEMDLIDQLGDDIVVVDDDDEHDHDEDEMNDNEVDGDNRSVNSGNTESVTSYQSNGSYQYGSYHSMSNGHRNSNYRSHPYSMRHSNHNYDNSARRYHSRYQHKRNNNFNHNNSRFRPNMHIKCKLCFRCLHHCKCYKYGIYSIPLMPAMPPMPPLYFNYNYNSNQNQNQNQNPIYNDSQIMPVITPIDLNQNNNNYNPPQQRTETESFPMIQYEPNMRLIDEMEDEINAINQYEEYSITNHDANDLLENDINGFLENNNIESNILNDIPTMEEEINDYYSSNQSVTNYDIAQSSFGLSDKFN